MRLILFGALIVGIIGGCMLRSAEAQPAGVVLLVVAGLASLQAMLLGLVRRSAAVAALNRDDEAGDQSTPAPPNDAALADESFPPR